MTTGKKNKTREEKDKKTTNSTQLTTLLCILLHVCGSTAIVIAVAVLAAFLPHMQAVVTWVEWGRPERLLDSSAGPRGCPRAAPTVEPRGDPRAGSRPPNPAAEHRHTLPPAAGLHSRAPLLPQHAPSPDPACIHHIVITTGQRSTLSPDAALVIAKHPSCSNAALLPCLSLRHAKLSAWWRARSIALITPGSGKCPCRAATGYMSTLLPRAPVCGCACLAVVGLSLAVRVGTSCIFFLVSFLPPVGVGLH